MKKIIALILVIGIASTGKAQKPGYYSNPVLAGFYPDPSICRVGTDYYLVNSSFAYYPGLPIFHSKDLVSWQQIGSAMNRPEQLPLIGAGVSRGLFAPAISYHNGLYYIVCTLVDKGGNFVITAKDPAGPWSNPVWLKEVDGIDPSLFFDKEDKAYIVYNSIPPDNKPLWNGHRTIRMRAFDFKNLKVSGEEKLVINGGTDISKKPVWIEGPHIYKIGSWYYLMCAEGGTSDNHSEVVFRSKSPEGPYTSYEGNPILTQRHLDPARKNPITSTGHADLVETPEGKWYAVFLGCRPYKDNDYNTGRETFMAPVKWKDEWPVITSGNEQVQYYYPLPFPKTTKRFGYAFSGNFTYHNDFHHPILDNRFIFLRTVIDNWYNTTNRKGFLAITTRPETAGNTGNPSFVGFRQQHNYCYATTALTFMPNAQNEKAGLVIFQNEHHFYYICQSLQDSKPVVQLYQSTPGDSMILLASQILGATPRELHLRIKSKGALYDFLHSTDGKRWAILKENADGTFLSTHVAGGFVGSVFALYTTSQGLPSSSTAFYNWFDYKGNDAVYENDPGK